MPLTAIPIIKNASETVVSEACDLTQNWQPQQITKPGLARSAPPDLDRAIGADVEASVAIDPVESPSNVLDSSTVAGQSLWFQVDVAKFDGAGSCRLREAFVLAVYARVTDRAFRVVPND